MSGRQSKDKKLLLMMVIDLCLVLGALGDAVVRERMEDRSDG